MVLLPSAVIRCRAARTAGALAVLLTLAGCRREVAVPDPELEALKALARYGPWAQVNDQGQVVRLRLDGKQVDDAALDVVPDFKHLYSLSLAYATVTDGGLARVCGMEKLEELGLVGTQVTDRGLAQLKTAPHLRRVWVRQSDGLTRAGIDALCAAAPELVVYDDNVPRSAARPGPP